MGETHEKKELKNTASLIYIHTIYIQYVEFCPLYNLTLFSSPFRFGFLKIILQMVANLTFSTDGQDCVDSPSYFRKFLLIFASVCIKVKGFLF